MIVARDLVKRYGAFAAVDGISFEVAPGESFGLLGPNGAGKSTTMRMVGAVSSRTDGELAILGLDPDRHGPDIRSQLGVVPQADNLDTELRVRENLLVYGRYFGLPRRVVAERADELLGFAQLHDKATAKVEELIHELGERYTIVIVTHNMQQAARVSDYTAFFYLGELVEFNDTDSLFTKPGDQRTEDYITGRFG